MLRTRSAPSRASASASTISSRFAPSSDASGDCGRQLAGQRRQLPAREIDVGDDVRERVVDLVRHARRQRADRRHAAGEDQLVLHVAPLGRDRGRRSSARAAPGATRRARTAARLTRSITNDVPSLRRPVVRRSLRLPPAAATSAATGACSAGASVSSQGRPISSWAAYPNISENDAVDRDHPTLGVGAKDRLRRLADRRAQLADLILQQAHETGRAGRRLAGGRSRGGA